MGRGGSHVSGGSAHHDSGGGGGGGSGKPANPIVTGIFLIGLGILFLILAIVVPVVMVADPDGDPCAIGDSLNLGEQMICEPPDLDETYIAEVRSVGSRYAKMYKAKKSALTTITRTQVWPKYVSSLDNDESAQWFNVLAPLGVTGSVHVHCSGTKCDKVKMYWLTESQFNSRFDSDGGYIEKDDYLHKDFEDDYDTSALSGKGVYYLVFSNKKERKAVLRYDTTLKYVVYDVSGLNPLACGEKGECEFEDMASGEVILIDVPSKEVREGESVYFDASIHNNDIDWSGVLAAGFILGILGIVCFVLAAIYLYKILKKLGKIGKKVVKKIEKEQEKKEAEKAAEQQAAAAQVAPVAYGDPNYGQQPYPGQPYPGQAYPAQQPYPGQPM